MTVTVYEWISIEFTEEISQKFHEVKIKIFGFANTANERSANEVCQLSVYCLTVACDLTVVDAKIYLRVNYLFATMK